MCRQSPLPLYLSSYPSASSSLSSALPPCRARHDKRNTTRPEQCVLLFWGLHLTHGMSSYDRRSWFHLDTCDTTASTETSLTQHFNSIFQHVRNFGPLMCSLCEEALRPLLSVYAPPLPQALCYDSGMYATTCDGRFRSEVILPVERRSWQNLHIRIDTMLGCIRRDLPWLLHCPTYRSQTAIHPPSALLQS